MGRLGYRGGAGLAHWFGEDAYVVFFALAGTPAHGPGCAPNTKQSQSQRSGVVMHRSHCLISSFRSFGLCIVVGSSSSIHRPIDHPCRSLLLLLLLLPLEAISLYLTTLAPSTLPALFTQTHARTLSQNEPATTTTPTTIPASAPLLRRLGLEGAEVHGDVLGDLRELALALLQRNLAAGTGGWMI